MASGREEIKYSSKASGSVRSISFMHTERLVPVDEAPDDEKIPEPFEGQAFSRQDAEELGETQSTSDKVNQAEDDVEVLHNVCGASFYCSCWNSYFSQLLLAGKKKKSVPPVRLELTTFRL